MKYLLKKILICHKKKKIIGKLLKQIKINLMNFPIKSKSVLVFIIIIKNDEVIINYFNYYYNIMFFNKNIYSFFNKKN